MWWTSLALAAADCGTGAECHAKGIRSIDPVEAVALFERGCTLGEPKACLELAGAYEIGRGVEADTARASTLRAQADQIQLQACTEGDGERCFQLALQHPEDAEAWYRKGCAADHAPSCAELATDADSFREKACSLGNDEACRALVKALWEQALAASKAGRREDAIGTWTRLHQDFPESPYEPWVLYNLGNSQAALGEPAEALRWFALADTHDGDWEGKAPTLIGMAKAYESLGDLDHAEATWRRLAAEHPDHASEAEAGLAHIAAQQP